MLLLATACTSGGGGGGTPTPSADPSAELNAARARLAVLAQATANGAYDAEYRFLQRETNTTGTVRIRQSPPRYRIDIVARRGASFFALMSGVVSCSTKGAKESCFLVAKPGEEVPALFDPGVQRLFRDAVEDLAANPTSYQVVRVDAPPTATPVSPSGSGSATAGTTLTPSPPSSPPGTPTTGPAPSSPPPPDGLPVGECFMVARNDTTPSPDQPAGFEDGTYCFAEQGVATSITVSSGTLTLVKLREAPKAEAFKPPARVQRLPELSPSPTPSKKK